MTNDAWGLSFGYDGFGNLTQQTQVVGAPLLDCAPRPRQLRGPVDVALDLLDEHTDIVGDELGLHDPFELNTPVSLKYTPPEELQGRR